MDVYELFKNRVSIRTYKSKDVRLEAVHRIIDAACKAPSWANKQCWRFIVVDSKVEKNIIGKASGQANIAKACEEAPFVIVICANPKDSGIKNGMEYYMLDVGLAMANITLSAQSEGLSTCIIGWFDEKAVKGVLNIPEGFRVIAYTPLGYADESIMPRPRKNKKDTVFYNQWGREFKDLNGDY